MDVNNRVSIVTRVERRVIGVYTKTSHFSNMSTYKRKIKRPISNQRPQFQVWMGDLDENWNEDSIIKVWNGLGEAPLSVKIIRDKSDPRNIGKPLYCFVNFANVASMNSALLKNGMNIPGTARKLKLNQASGASGPGSNGYNKVVSKPPQDDSSLFFNNIDKSLTELEIFDRFNARFPTSVRQVKIITDANGQSKGQGFIKFNSSVTQQIAFREMNGIKINGFPVVLTTAASEADEESGILVKDITLPQFQPPLNKYTNPHNTTIEIKGLGGRFTENEVENECFFGDIITLCLSKDLNSAIVVYRFREDAKRAILFLNHCIRNGCKLEVNWGDQNQIAHFKRNINIYQPNISYGKSPLTRFDKLSPKDIKDWTESVYEESEPSGLYHSVNTPAFQY